MTKKNKIKKLIVLSCEISPKMTISEFAKVLRIHGLNK
jgi:hypothetical protein